MPLRHILEWPNLGPNSDIYAPKYHRALQNPSGLIRKHEISQQ